MRDDTGYKSPLPKMVRAIEAFRQLNKDMLANEMMAFLLVAERNGISMTELQDVLDLSKAATSRNVNFLSQHGANSRDGLKLVITTENPENRRQKLVHLTPRGKALKRQIESLLDAAP